MPARRAGRGLRVIIAGAGGAAHLPGMCAAWTPLPVLGVPVESHALKGMDSLLSIVQMPAGIPVGTLAIGRAGAVNAALLAAAILAPADPALAAAAGRLARGADAGGGGGAARPGMRDTHHGRVPTLRPSLIAIRDLSAPAQRHHRPGRRRPARPHVRHGRGAAGLSLPHPDA